MDYIQLRSNLITIAYKYDMTYYEIKKRIKALLKILKKLNLYTAFIKQAA